MRASLTKGDGFSNPWCNGQESPFSFGFERADLKKRKTPCEQGVENMERAMGIEPTLNFAYSSRCKSSTYTNKID